MNLRHWQHFLEIAARGSLSSAAAKLGVAQPALSREMGELEEAVGATLFTRHSRGIRLTEAGERFRLRAESILRQIVAVPREVQALEGEPSGNLAVGFPPSMSGNVTASAVAFFHRSYPQVRLQVREGTATQIRDALLSRQIDVGIVTLPMTEPDLVVTPLSSEPMVLVGPAGSPLLRGDPVRVSDLAGLPLILAKRPNSVRLLVENALQEIGREPNVVIETDVAPVTDFVRQGIGYSVLPRSYPAGRNNVGLTWQPVEGIRIHWAIGLIKGADVSIAIRRMIEIIRAEAARQPYAEVSDRPERGL